MKSSMKSLDQSFWLLESPETPQNVGTISLLEGIPDIEKLKGRVGQLIVDLPHLADHNDDFVWRSAEFQIEKHFIVEESEDFLERAGDWLSKQFSIDMPPWRFVLLINQKNQSSASLFFHHHSLADGQSGAKLHQLVSDSLVENGKRKERNFLALSNIKKQIGYLQRVKLLGAEILAKRSLSSLNGKNNSSKRSISIVDLRLEDIKLIKREFNIPFNDVLTSLIASSVRKYELARKTAKIVDPRVIVPVGTRVGKEFTEIGNYLSAAFTEFPTAEVDSVNRLCLQAKRSKKLLSSGALEVLSVFGQVVGRLPRALQAVVYRQNARRTNFICTTVPGPREERQIAGARVLANYGVAALMPGHGVSFCYVTYAKGVYLAIVCDPAIVPDVDLLAGGVTESLVELLGEVQKGERKLAS